MNFELVQSCKAVWNELNYLCSQLSLKVDEIFKQKESSLSFYKELSIISWAEWDCRQKKELYKLLVEKREDLSQKIIYKI